MSFRSARARPALTFGLGFVTASAALVTIVAWIVSPASAQGAPVELELLGVRMIWDAAPHNAFTDLAHFNGRWYCAFREGRAHVSPDGKLRVITSKDGLDWASCGLLSSPKADLRDAKLAITPQGELMLTGAAALHDPEPVRHQTLAWFSRDGAKWSDAVPIGEPNFWLWRVTWHDKVTYGIGYATKGTKLARLYRSDDGRHFETLVSDLGVADYPNESSLVFSGDQAYCLLRRDPSHGLLGQAKTPYRDWTWRDVGARIGGPHAVHIEANWLLAATRLYDGSVRTSLSWIDLEQGKLTETLRLPSGGDTSYAGMVVHDHQLWVSYYSSHGEKTAVYLARMALQGADGSDKQRSATDNQAPATPNSQQ